MGFRRVAVIMAGGSGTRFWPVSTPERPKQFLRLASDDESLLQQSVGRIVPLVGEAGVHIATTAGLVEATRTECPQVPGENVFGEPHRRNTLGALVWATAVLQARDKDAQAGSLHHNGDSWRELSLAVLTADHMIGPPERFRGTVEKAMSIAEERGSLVTIGIAPDRPATEYGYVETGAEIGGGWEVARFTEKPDEATAEEFVASGSHLWNSGMFFWTLGSFCDELSRTMPDARAALAEIAGALGEGDESKAAEQFGGLTNVSVDYAVMERAENVAVVKAEFEWDDLGSWDALGRILPSDEAGNVAHGAARTVESEGCVVYNGLDGTAVSVLGMKDAVVVVTDGQVLVCPRSRVQDVGRLAD